MRPKLFVYLIAAGAVFFASGIAIGQHTATSKFAKYLGPAVQTDMDLIALRASVDALRWNLPVTTGMGAPVIYFDYKENRPEASVTISAELEKEPPDKVKSKIVEEYSLTWTMVRRYIPDLSGDDFVLRIFRHVNDPTPFAECKNGHVEFR
jgi:hypothetical protein